MDYCWTENRKISGVVFAYLKIIIFDLLSILILISKYLCYHPRIYKNIQNSTKYKQMYIQFIFKFIFLNRKSSL